MASLNPVASTLRGLGHHVDRLTRSILARASEPTSRSVPEVGHSARLADEHARRRLHSKPCERGASVPGGHDVRAEVAETPEGVVIVSEKAGETTVAASGDVFEEDALDGIVGAEAQDLVTGGLDERRHRSRVYE